MKKLIISIPVSYTHLINVPALTEETRKELCKKVSKLSEEAKIAVRNLRRDANEIAKKDDTLTAVSYTHLDVYKRQKSFIAR